MPLEESSGRSSLATIDREEILRRRSEPAFFLVNVLPRAAFELRRIPGSLSLPLADIREQASRVIPARDAEVAVYCTGPS